GAVSFQTEFKSLTTNMMQLGFATRLGGLYLGAYYGGNTFAQWREQTYYEEDGKRVYRNPWDIEVSNYPGEPHNEASLLLGVADMGFRISYVHSYRSFKRDDFNVGSLGSYTSYVTYKDEYGSINPEIAWGMARELIPGRGLQPHVYIDLDFFRDYRISDTGSGDDIDHSNNEFTLGFTAASGYFSFFNQNGFDFGIDVWYTLNLKTFGNKYTLTPGGDIVSFKGKLITDPADPFAGRYDVSYNAHWLTPYLYAGWSGEKLELSAELGFEFGFSGRRNRGLLLSASDQLWDGADTKVFGFSFAPTLNLGLKWGIVPEKFYLNAGSGISFFGEGGLGVDKLTIDTYVSNGKVGDTVKATNSFFDGALTRLMLGFTFYPTVNLGVQAMSGVDISSNNINVFNTGTAAGLAVFSKIMVTVKF
ncbi:MAG: hypothetical protein FWH41_08005, partial [Treponema sp.]|nr:hypothetical protein [Treponema sp.]